MRQLLASAAIASTVAFATPAAAEMPAVAGTNVGIEGFGMMFDNEKFDEATYGLGASLALPLGEQFGVQFDAIGNDLDGEFVWGAAGRAFWRSPTVGRFGVAVSHVDVGDLFDMQQYAIEGEWFANWLTLSGLALYQDEEILDGGWLFGLGARAYVTDNLVIQGGALSQTYDDIDDLSFNLGAQAQLFNGFSLYGDARFADEAEELYTVGIKLNLGGRAKTLKEQHRMEEVENFLLGTLTGTGLAGAGNVIAAAAFRQEIAPGCAIIGGLLQTIVNSTDPSLQPLADAGYTLDDVAVCQVNDQLTVPLGLDLDALL